ncbi:hypothetical protein ABDK56_10100 [Sphingomonas sp. ASV193]|uniref:hypothetical protein n=1 Tax=Sphingomonas sp. ASV193 TaxID=3144405 RepID=UPI0032E90608
MHVHLPKPLHGWRAFFGEVGIIVLGVLIALGAQRLADNWQQARDAEQSRMALRSEIGDDNLPQAYVRLAIAPCLDSHLKMVQSAFQSGLDRKEFAQMTQSFVAPERTWDKQAWDASTSTGALAHEGAKELMRWAFPYTIIAQLADWNMHESEDLADLRSVRPTPGAFTADEADRVTRALEHLKHDQFVMLNLSMVLMHAAAKVGVALNDGERRRLLAETHKEWGSCATPSPQRVAKIVYDVR